MISINYLSIKLCRINNLQLKKSVEGGREEKWNTLPYSGHYYPFHLSLHANKLLVLLNEDICLRVPLEKSIVEGCQTASFVFSSIVIPLKFIKWCLLHIHFFVILTIRLPLPKSHLPHIILLLLLSLDVRSGQRVWLLGRCLDGRSSINLLSKTRATHNFSNRLLTIKLLAVTHR